MAIATVKLTKPFGKLAAAIQIVLTISGGNCHHKLTKTFYQ